WNQVLRVVSSAWSDERRIYVSTVDVSDPNDLVPLAELEFERARGDSLFATRFDGARAYVVTYFVVDPLFVVDLSDPMNPSIEGELEVPGWSTYIEPMGDRLLALGVDDTNGRRVSMSLFNVADPANPFLIERVSFGQNWSWSSAYNDVKALTVLDDLIIVPFSGWEDDFGGFERLQFISYTPDDLTKNGVVDVEGTVLRTFGYNDLYYAATTEQLAKIDATDRNAPQVVDSIVLAENVADFVELSASLGVELITQYDTGLTIARRADLPLKSAAGEVEVAIGELVDAFAYGSSAVLVGATWDGESAYKVAIVDFTDPNAPEIDAIVDVDVSPYYGYWWWGPYLPYIDTVGVASDALIAPWYPVQQQGSAFLIGNRLVLRCSADSYDDVIGGEAPNEGLAIVDLTQPAWTSTVGLGFERVVSVHDGDGKVYIASKVALNSFNVFGDPLCAYFVTAFDPATGAASPTANVPGIFVQYDAATQIMTLRDDQWSAGYDYTSTLNTVQWTGGDTVTELDELTLPDGTSNVLGRGSKIFLEAYDNGVLLYGASVAANGNLSLGQSTLVTDGWANLIDAKGASAYLSVGGGAIARYDCTGKPSLEELVQVMGTPSQMHFGSSAAYAPLGYFGIVSLEL
ncbi:MAG: beta-propeller domain-containing protein, partial [Candidatus Hydrogenedentes bacterium]|nr:beta-propeller domain-containing protein [Candidatus Hydrogenedentota bacterium]